MSVETHGQAGYDQQYRASALIGLLLLGPGGTLVVEPTGGEDASIQAAGGVVIELQSKASGDVVSVDALAEWLLHYPPHADSGSLLERLATDRRVILACGGRCADALQPFVATWARAELPVEGLHRDTVTAMRVALAARASALQSGESELDKRRGAAAAALLSRWGERKLRDALSHARIVDNVDRADLCARIRASLADRYRVARSRAEDCALAIDDAIRRARDSRGDAWAEIRRILRRFENTPALAPDWPNVSRPDEDDLLAALRARKALLLTGVSQCGKTQTARALGERLRQEGFVYRERSDFQEASSFLLAPGSDEHVLLIDDPDLVLHPSGIARLRDALTLVRPHRLLMVTGPLDRLALAYGSSDPSTWNTRGIPWVDLTVRDRRYATQVWRELARGLPDDDRAEGERLIGAGAVTPQPGALEEIRLGALPLPRLAALVAGAESGTGALRDQLGKGALEMAGMLVLGADQVHRIPTEGLGWLTSPSDDRPGLRPQYTTRGGVIGGNLPPPEFPNWPRVDLSSEAEAALNELRERGWIETDDRGVRFVHPRFVRAAAEWTGSEARWYALVTKAVSSLDPQGASIALQRLAEATSGSEPDRRWVATCVAALRSLFPRVRDAAAMMMARRFGELEAGDAEALFEAVSESQHDEGDLLFHDDTPGTPWWLRGESWLDPRQDHDFGEGIIERFEGPSADALASIRDGTLPAAREALRLARGAVAGRVELSTSELDRLLTAGERFVREEAVRARILRPEPLSDLQLDVLFSDHPAVIANALHAFFAAVPTLPRSERERMVARFRGALRLPVVALASTFILEDLEDALGHESSLPMRTTAAAHWEAWGELAPHWLAGLPHEPFRIRQGRLWNTADRARPHLTPSAVANVAREWIRLIERREGRLFDSYGLGVVDFLTVGTGPDDREELLVGLLTHPIERLQHAALRTALEKWDALSPRERDETRAAVFGGGAGHVWRLLLLFDAGETALVEQAFGPRTDEDSLAGLVGTLPEEVLAAGLRQHFGLQVSGDPGWYGPCEYDRWRRIVHVLLLLPEHPQYELAVGALLSNACAGDWPDRAGAWDRCVAAADQPALDLLARELAHWSALNTHCHLAPYWSRWWTAADAGARSRAVGAVLADLEAISSRSDRSDVLPQVLWKEIVGQLHAEEAAIVAVGLAVSGAESVDEVVRRLKPLRLRARWVAQALELDARDLDERIAAVIHSMNQEILARAESQRKSWREKPTALDVPPRWRPRP